MWKKLLQIVNGEDCELQERMFRAITLIGGGAAFLGTLECFLVGKMNAALFPVFLVLLATMVVSLAIVFRYRKYDVAAVILYFLIICMVFPCLFFFGGGTNGAAAVWFSLGILYTFIMFRGGRLAFFLSFCALVYGGAYLVAYRYPELVTEMPSRGMLFLDVYFGVMVVGIAGGIVIKSQLRIYDKEHQLNIKQREELEKSRDSKNAFFANMSHEIRTPINTIIGLNEMILRECESEEIKEYARDIKLASSLLLNQVNDILDLSQMEMDKMKLVPVRYQTAELFGDLVELVRVRMEKKGLRLYTEIDEKLPAALYGDVKRLEQVLLNLLDNAVKYTEEGSVILSAEGEETGNGELMLTVKVADTGIGIRKEDIEFLYDAYNRMDEKRNLQIMGSGLGLAITKQLVDLMDGEISVDSIYTKGTVFTVRLLQKIEDPSPVGIVNISLHKVEQEEHYIPSFEAPEARILVVDDNAMNVRVAVSLLSGTKMQIDRAYSGEECLEMAKKKFYDAILLDYMMPVMNGRETLTELRRQENGLCRESAIIALTANAVSGAREQYREEGFDGYVEKPILGKTLEYEILRLLSPDIVEYVEKNTPEADRITKIQQSVTKKKKKIYITTDCVCDLPTELLEKYDIRLMYLYIKTPHGRFADTREIDSDSLTQYISAEASMASADSATVEEYEEFFAEVLTGAEQVIHISLGSRSGATYSVAQAAAKNFDHVHIIDSGQISCGEGLMVLHAAKLAQEGKNVGEIFGEIERIRNHIRTMFVMPGGTAFHQNGYMRSITVRICKNLQLRPLVVMRKCRPTPVGLLGGTIEQAWIQGIRWHLRNKKKIDTQVVFITHVGCSVKQLELIQNEILRMVPFERVIIQKASFSNACNSGLQTIGVAYYSL